MTTTDTKQVAAALTQDGPAIETNNASPAQSVVLDHPEGDEIRRQVSAEPMSFIVFQLISTGRVLLLR